MFRSVFRRGSLLRLGRYGLAAAVLGCLGLSGCCNLGDRNEQFRYDPAFELGSQYRPGETQLEPVAASNKSMQIEHSLGVR